MEKRSVRTFDKYIYIYCFPYLDFFFIMLMFTNILLICDSELNLKLKQKLRLKLYCIIRMLSFDQPSPHCDIVAFIYINCQKLMGDSFEFDFI